MSFDEMIAYSIIGFLLFGLIFGAIVWIGNKVKLTNKFLFGDKERTIQKLNKDLNEMECVGE